MTPKHLCLALLLASSSAAQEPLFPSIAEVVPRALELEAEAARLEGELEGLRADAGLAEEGAALARRNTRLRDRLAAIQGAAAVDGERLARLRARAERQRRRADELRAAASARYQRLEELGARWEEQRSFWSEWQARLRAEPGFGPLRGDFLAAQRSITSASRALAAEVPAARQAQQEAQELLREQRELTGEIERELARWERSLTERSAPALLAPAFWRQLAAPPARPKPEAALDGAFLETHARTFAFQLLLALAIGLAARWFHRAADAGDPWRGLLAHPWALGVFAAIVGMSSLYDPAPGAWRLLPEVALAGSLALVASGAFARRRERWTLYLLAAVFVALAASEALGLREPASRLALAAVALLPQAVLVPFFLRERREHGRLTPFGWGLRAGAAVLGAVAVAEILGFHPLARWLLRAALSTAVIIFVAAFVIRLSRKASRFLLARAATAPSPLLAEVREEIARRALRLVKIAAVIVALLFAADAWHLADSPAAAWQKLLGWNAAVGPYRITAGQVLLAGLALYAAMVVSWVLRAVVDDRVRQGSELDRGMGDSIKTLLRYGLIVVGLFLALSLLGIDLRNFAILAGAFGVGIGFGLQNIVSNFVSGLILLFERPVRSGDWVEVGGDSGQVRSIGLRSTVLQTIDRAEVIVPNSQLIAERVTNWTLTNRIARLVVPVGVAYGSDLETVRAILDEIARAHPDVLDQPPPNVQVVALGESAVELELRACVADLEERPAIQSQLLLEILRRFAAAGIVVPFPQRDVHLKKG